MRNSGCRLIQGSSISVRLSDNNMMICTAKKPQHAQEEALVDRNPLSSRHRPTHQVDHVAVPQEQAKLQYWTTISRTLHHMQASVAHNTVSLAHNKTSANEAAVYRGYLQAIICGRGCSSKVSGRMARVRHFANTVGALLNSHVNAMTISCAGPERGKSAAGCRAKVRQVYPLLAPAAVVRHTQLCTTPTVT